MMRKFVGSLALALCLGLPAAQSADAAVAIGTAGAALPSPIQEVQYFFGGANYCWYLDGWNGPGWYRCGFAFRQGFGWGGGYGWNNWGGGRGFRGGRGGFHGGGFHGGGHGGGGFHGGGHGGGGHGGHHH